MFLFLQILFGKSFQSLFADSQRCMNNISRSIFKIWNFLPLISNAFPLTKTFSSYLSRGFYQYEKDLDTNWKILEGKHTKIYQLQILKLVVVRSLCFGLNISPPLALIAKNGVFVSPIIFSPLVWVIRVKIIPIESGVLAKGK
jgi:hypothetical protein